MHFTPQECSGMAANILRRMEYVIENYGKHVDHLVSR